ncbi:hypothetical protein [Conchiformibius kuhniae]|uniref:Uncharacterized protein n=1 Tax=Conchiformibius kuhniae TaxID=211502 RepID=A0A8T9MYK5_9NEIS|nr:hypothetical protein [Conchiformibius kuhniae]UOP05568.1 hypothetical protein LVJ77_05540 [Conchiformibius kuhniae]
MNITDTTSRQTAASFAEAFACQAGQISWREWQPYYPVGSLAHAGEFLCELCLWGMNAHQTVLSPTLKNLRMVLILMLSFGWIFLSVRWLPLSVIGLWISYRLYTARRPTVQVDFTAKTVCQRDKQHTQTIEINSSCCLAYSIFGSLLQRDAYIVFNLYHDNGKCTQLLGMAAAPPFGKADTDTVRHTQAFARYLADRLNIRLITE